MRTRLDKSSLCETNKAYRVSISVQGLSMYFKYYTRPIPLRSHNGESINHARSFRKCTEYAPELLGTFVPWGKYSCAFKKAEKRFPKIRIVTGNIDRSKTNGESNFKSSTGRKGQPRRWRSLWEKPKRTNDTRWMTRECRVRVPNAGPYIELSTRRANEQRFVKLCDKWI